MCPFCAVFTRIPVFFVPVLFAPRLQALLATMQQQLATSAMLQATHHALMTRVNSTTDLHQRRQQQQQEDNQPPPSPQQQQQELQLSTAAPMRPSSTPIISPGHNRCDSPAPSLAEMSMADMAMLGAAAAEQPGGSAQQRQQPSPSSSSRLAMQSEARDSGMQQQKPGLQEQQQKERGAAGLPSNKLYGRSTVKGSRDRERYLAPTGYL